MLQGLGIRGKLLAVVAFPTIVLLLAASFVVFNAVVDQSSARNTDQLVTLVQDGAAMVRDVQAERGDVLNYLSAVSDGLDKSSNAGTAVDNAVATIKAAAAEDPAYAAAASGISAAVSGAGGEDGLDTYREITTVPAVDGDFAAWPEPAAVATAQAGFIRIADEVEAAAVGAPVSETGNVIRGLADLIRTEGVEVATYLNESKQYADALPGDFAKLDSSAPVFLTAAGEVADRPENASVVELLVDAERRLGELPALRGDVRAGTVLPGTVDTLYTGIVDGVLAMTRGVADSSANRQLATYLTAYAAMNELFEAVSLEENYVTRKIRDGGWFFGEPARFQRLYFGTGNALENAKLAVNPLPNVDDVPSFGASFDVAETNGFQVIRDRLVVDSTDEGLLDQRNADWEVQVAEELAVMEPLRAELLTQVKQEASDLVRNSLVQLLATIAIAAAVFVVSLVVTLSMARRIINPLRRLTTTATAVRQELPRLVERVALPGQSVDVSEVQIPVESQDEVGRLAEAFNSVNAATLSIAAEQAALRGSISEMFVNVARRDQVLLNRQLSSIDEMERTEDNQTTLTKLFALDHLATRMRRNSESLLVLAGIDTGRRLRRSMPLSDVIRTASSEIELYERVQLELDADPSMLGHSALTAAHMFAELLENATVFSDPGTPVVVRTMSQGDDICVEVVDYGIGMTPEELGEANARVA
jgi:signal transduction histidine kinase